MEWHKDGTLWQPPEEFNPGELQDEGDIGELETDE